MATRAHTVPRFYLSGFAAPVQTAIRDPFVWMGSLATGAIDRRSPKNISISRGYYDGIGGFEDPTRSIENHLAKIESEAAFAIRRFVASAVGGGVNPSAEIWRFLSWQAARTPGWFKLVEQWMNDCEPGTVDAIVERPPEGFESIKDRPRSHLVEDPSTGEKREVADLEELRAFWKRGWKWTPTVQDRLEMLHLQAWYFQVRHFPRLSWTRLDTPSDDWFVTSDRAVAWLVDGYADTPPAALRDPSALVVAPLTKKTALVGRHGSSKLQVTPREINCIIAFAASAWIAGPTEDVVALAMRDRLARRIESESRS